MSVMLVDSVGMATGTLSNILQPMGFYRIYTVKSAEEALQTIAEGKEISLIISMWKLKAMSGPQLVETLRGRFKDLPIILIVDIRDKIIEEKAAQAGATALLQQPVDVKSVSAAVDNALAPFIDEEEEAFNGHMHTARIAAHKENYKQAVKEFQAALAVREDDYAALLGLADAMRMDGQTQEVEQLYMKVLRAQPDNLRAYMGLAAFYQAGGRLADALKVLTYAQANKTEGEARTGILMQMGEIELMLQHLQNALGYFDQAVEASPADSNLSVRAADALVSVGELEQSERFYQKALEQNPNLAHVYNRLGIAYRQQKKFGQALELYRKALEYSPKDENLLYNMARSLWEMDDFSGAEDILNQALKINPQFVEARQLLQAIKKGLKPLSQD